jgi:hypothetical protein
MRFMVLVLLVSSSNLLAAPDSGPSRERIKSLAAVKGAVDKMSVYAVDETCFPAELPVNAPKGASISASAQNGKVVEQNLTTTGLTNFARFRAWAKKYGTKGRTVAFGLDSLGDQDFGYKAWCLGSVPLLAGAKSGFVKKPEVAGVLWSGDTLSALKKIPPDVVRRLAIVHDKSVVVAFVRVADLASSKESELGFVFANYTK